jgi:hypothetical protein
MSAYASDARKIRGKPPSRRNVAGADTSTTALA